MPLERDVYLRDPDNLYRENVRPELCPRCREPITYVAPEEYHEGEDGHWERYDAYLVCDACGLSFNSDLMWAWSDKEIDKLRERGENHATDSSLLQIPRSD